MPSIIDLSHPIEARAPMFPGHPGPEVEIFVSREASRAHYSGDTSFLIHRYRFVGNTGTYLDAPYHRFADGADLASLPLAATVDLPGRVVDVAAAVEAGRHAVTAEQVAPAAEKGGAALIHTGWSVRWGDPAYLGEKPFLSADAARLLAERGVALVGIDTWNIDDVADGRRPAHTLLLRVGVPIVENLRGLDRLAATRFRFFAAPLPFSGGSAIPVRAFAIVG